jgi:hypothetical protein
MTGTTPDLPQPSLEGIAMNHIHRILAALAGLSGALLVSLTVAPAALATLPARQRPHAGPGFISPSPRMTYTVPIGGHPGTPLISPPPAVTHTVTTGGMPGWQITLIAAGAALAAAAVTLLLNRARTSHNAHASIPYSRAVS